MDELCAERVVLLDFLLGYQQTIKRLPPESQLGLWGKVIDLLYSIAQAITQEEMVQEHQKLHDLGSSIHCAQLRWQAKDRSRQPRSSLPPAGL